MDRSGLGDFTRCIVDALKVNKIPDQASRTEPEISLIAFAITRRTAVLKHGIHMKGLSDGGRKFRPFRRRHNFQCFVKNMCSKIPMPSDPPRQVSMYTETKISTPARSQGVCRIPAKR